MRQCRRARSPRDSENHRETDHGYDIRRLQTREPANKVRPQMNRRPVNEVMRGERKREHKATENKKQVNAVVSRRRKSVEPVLIGRAALRRAKLGGEVVV